MSLKIPGFLLLLAGWLLVLAALVMLPDGLARNAFVAAGVAVEGLGLTIAVRAHMTPKSPDRNPDRR
jgi:hypothetical protein